MKKLLWVFLISSLWAKDIDAVLAIVNNEIITKSDLELAKQQEQSLRLDNDKLLDLLIDEAILVEQAKLMQISISEQDIDNMAATFSTNNNQTLQSVLTSQGLSMQDFREKLRHQLLAMRVQAALLKNKPTAKEIENFWQQHKADGLMVAFDDRVYASKDLLQTNKKVKPIHIALTALKSLPKPYKEIMSKDPFKKTYGPIKTENGYHMVTVTTWQGELMPKTYAANFLMMQAIAKARPALVTKLRKNMYIKIYK